MAGEIEITDCENDTISNSVIGYGGSENYNLSLPDMSVDLGTVSVAEETFNINFIDGWKFAGFSFDISTVTKIEYLNGSGVLQATNSNPTMSTVYLYTKQGFHIQKKTSSNAGLINNGYQEEVHQTLSVGTLFELPKNDNKVIIVKDYQGSAYLPQFNFDGIGFISRYESLQCKCSDNFTLRITAKRNHQIVVSANGDESILYGGYIRFWPGWSMLNWPCKYSADVALALASVVENVIIVKDYQGSVYIPEYNFNGIPDFIPGEGFQVKIKDNKTNYIFVAENE